jgi:hypothetical protein
MSSITGIMQNPPYTDAPRNTVRIFCTPLKHSILHPVIFKKFCLLPIYCTMLRIKIDYFHKVDGFYIVGTACFP